MSLDARDTDVAPPGRLAALAAQRPARRPVRPLRWLTLALGAVALVPVMVEAGFQALPALRPWAGTELRVFFSPWVEHNGWAWFNGVLLAGAAVAHAAAGWLARAGGARGWPWFVTAGLLLAMSLDDVTVLHERLDRIGAGGDSRIFFTAWLLPGSVLAVGVLVSFWVLARQLSAQPRLLLVLGVGAFFGAAVGVENAGHAVARSQGQSTLQLSLVFIEELAEAWGAIAILAAALAALTVHVRRGVVEVRYTG